MKTAKAKLPKGGHHTNPKPRLRTRHMSSVGKSAYSGGGGASAVPAFPAPGPGAPAFGAPDGAPPQAPGVGGADSAPLTGPSGGPPGM